MLKTLSLPSLFMLSFTIYSQDIVITAYKGRTTFDQYQTFNEIFTVKNDDIVDITTVPEIGNFAYLSTDAVIDASDYMIGFAEFGVLKAGQSLDLKLNWGACNVAPGVYNLVIRSDGAHVLTEKNKENNIYVVSGITIHAPNVDWQFNSLVVPSVLHQNEPITPTFQIRNSGTTNTGGQIFTKFYISKDVNLDAGDSYYGTAHSWLDGMDTINAGSCVWYNERPAIPPHFKLGDYYLIGKVDSQDDFIETNESNNISVSNLLSIAPSNIDLSFVAPLNSDIDTLGASYFLSILFQIQNSGSTGAGGYKITTYLSSDKYLTPGIDYRMDCYYQDKEAPYVQPNELTNSKLTRALYPGPIPNGKYYLILVINEDRSMKESNYDNNIIVSSSANIILPPSLKPPEVR